LGRALMALGRNRAARDAYSRALQLDPTNQIARKNLAILEKKVEAEAEAAAPSAPREHADPRLFVEETGKTGLTVLQHPQRETLMRMTPGERVYLRPDRNRLIAQSAGGEVIGDIETRIALRLIRMMQSGNEYGAAISQMGHDTARII